MHIDETNESWRAICENLEAKCDALRTDRDEWKQRAERAERYVDGQDIRSDFPTATEMRAALDAEREAVRVLGAEVWWWNYYHSDHDEICKAKVARKNNTIASEAVKGNPNGEA